MPIRGSFRNHKSLNKANIDSMCHETVRDSVEEMKKDIQKKTPVDEGHLKAAWETTPTTKPYPNHYRAKVQNETEYARYVEYGTAPHVIAAREGSALAFGDTVVSKVNHPGTDGVHMASRGAAHFEQHDAEQIAKRNLRKYLL